MKWWLKRKDDGIRTWLALPLLGLVALQMACGSKQADAARRAEAEQELQQLRETNQELQRLRAENQELPRLRRDNEELKRLSEQTQELARLRQENLDLRARLQSLKPTRTRP